MSGKLEQIVDCEGWDRRRVSEQGQVTIPQELREKHGIQPSDAVVVGENTDGDLCIVKPGE